MQVVYAPETPTLNLNDLRRVAKGARAAQLGDITFQGYFRVIPVPVVADTTLGAGFVVLCDASGGHIDVTLPAVATSNGYVYAIKKADAGAQTVTISGDGTIDGAASLTLTAAWQVVWLVCDGTRWLSL